MGIKFELIILSPNERIAQHQEFTLEAKVVMGARVVVGHVIATDHVIVVDTDPDQDHGAVITAIDLLLHTEDDHHTNAIDEMFALESKITLQTIN